MSNRTLNLDATVYEYLLSHSLREHPAQVALRDATRDHPHATMQISPEQGQFMALLIRLMGCHYRGPGAGATASVSALHMSCGRFTPGVALRTRVLTAR